MNERGRIATWKGTRRRVSVRMPLPLWYAVTRAAANQGVTVNDWLCQAADRATREQP